MSVGCNCESLRECGACCFSRMGSFAEKCLIFTSCYCFGRNTLYGDDTTCSCDTSEILCDIETQSVTRRDRFTNILCCCWLSRCCCDCVDRKRLKYENVDNITPNTVYFCPPANSNWYYYNYKINFCCSKKCTYNCSNPLFEHNDYNQDNYNVAGNDKCCCFFTYYPGVEVEEK